MNVKLETKPSTLDKYVDTYLLHVDNMFNFFVSTKAQIDDGNSEGSWVNPRSSSLLKFTLFGLFFVFVCMLASCKTVPVKAPITVSPRSNMVSDKKPETLYIRRDESKIQNRETGSATGSIYADNDGSRDFFSDEARLKVGDYVNVQIPKELQFNHAPNSSTGDLNKGASAADIKLSDPFAVGGAGGNSTPLSQFKMQVVSIDDFGNAFLRGNRNYSSTQGEHREVDLTARAPRKTITNYEVGADKLDSVKVAENKTGNYSDYVSTSWDQIISRKIAGYTPDLDSEVEKLESIKQEMVIAQNNLRDRSKALNEEKERMKKDRERIALAQATQAARLKESEEKKASLTKPEDTKAGAAAQKGEAK